LHKRGMHQSKVIYGGVIMKKKAQSLTVGTMILFVSALAVKIIGALFKIPLTNRIGGQGMGYYMTAYSVFNPVYAVSVAGFPAAIARVTAIISSKGDERAKRRITHNAFLTFAPIGVMLSAMLYLFSHEAAKLVGNADASPAIRAIAPAVMFCCLTSVLRGTFEGQRNMIPTALEQFFESVVKLAAGLSLVALTIKTDPLASPVELACAALWGVALSTLVGFLCMAFFCIPQKRIKKESYPRTRFYTDSSIRKLLLSTAVPICLAALVTNLTSFIDLVTVMNGLKLAIKKDAAAVYFSHPKADLFSIPMGELPNFLFGSYAALAMTVFHLVPALIVPLCTSALPFVSNLKENGRNRETRIAVGAVLKAAAAFAVPAGIGISALSEPILLFLFPDSIREVAVAANILRPLGIASAFSAMACPVSSLLQAVGRSYVPARLMLKAAVIKLVVNILLIPFPWVNINAAAWGTLLCYAFITVRGISVLLEETASPLNPISIFLKPLFCGGLCALTAVKVLSFLNNTVSFSLSLCISIAAGGIMYLIAMVVLRAFAQEEADILISKIKK